MKPWYRRMWNWLLGPELSKPANAETEWFFSSPDTPRMIEFSDLQDPNSFDVVNTPPPDTCDRN